MRTFLVNNPHECYHSMWPLLKKDGLGAQYVAMLLLWCRLIGYNPLRVQFDSYVHLLSTVRYHSDTV